MEKTPDLQTYLDHILKNIPHEPGVYKMKDKDGNIIYVGKAKNLKNRVSSYFQNRNDKAMRTQKMVEHIADIEYIVVKTELEALLLETNWIKEIRPKYNILMKDDKSYVYIKITTQDLYPRIYLVRKVDRDRARYFGPKTAGHKVIKTLKVLKKVFPFRNCELAIDYTIHTGSTVKKTLSESQLQYHISHCIGPCVASVKPENYRKMIDEVINFLEGKHEGIIEKIKEDMYKAASEKKFEVAASIRDRLKAVEEIIEPQRISDPHQKDLDIINYVEQDDKIYFNLFQLRNGKLIGQENFIFKAQTEREQEDPEALNAFLEQYYEKATDLPKEILIPHHVDEPEMIEQWLSQVKGQKVSLIIPERGKKNQLLELSLANAQSYAKQSQIKWQGAEKETRTKALEGLQKILGLTKIPRRLECYDISHFSGTETVASMVVFENGFPKKDDYRKFKLHQQTAGAPDDFASMEEALTRRIKYLKPSINLENLKIKKAKKKELEEIKKELKAENLPVGDFLAIEKEKKRIGYAHVNVFPSKKTLIEDIHIIEKLDTGFLIKKLIEKYKVHRMYLLCDTADQAKYEEFGFEAIKKLPDEFAEKEGQTYLVFDRNKYSEDSSFKKVPDLIIIDGGKGQLSSAIKALNKYGLPLTMISIAKKEEELFRPNESESIKLEKNNPILHMIQHIRDEAHRFAITYHKNLRSKASMSSILDTLPGIGPETKILLLKQFGSVEGIKNAQEEELIKLIGPTLAKKLKDSL
ncbi:MAG: excinuclease ABC subunit UvrC [Candidatus Gracilibacteria bacterium]|jgi:excinuclease ABC subunit C